MAEDLGGGDVRSLGLIFLASFHIFSKKSHPTLS
jgi:hypothetical protein